jgi:hypothetical protein
MDNLIFCFFVDIGGNGQVKISFGQPVLAVFLPDGQVDTMSSLGILHIDGNFPEM